MTCKRWFELSMILMLRNITSVALVIVTLAACGGVFAQQATPSPTVKRNSPFSPNPKKKTDIPRTTEVPPQNAVSEVKTTPVDPVANVVPAPSITGSSETSKPTTETVAETKAPANNETQSSQTESEKKVEETPVSTNGEQTTTNVEPFESRSVASKTLEVAKRANPVAVSPTEIYRIGVGDVLLIALQNAPARETTYFTVLKDGTIDYPLAGELVSVVGMTEEEIEVFLREKIKLYENPQVSVKVREHTSHGFSVLGMVERAGEKTMQRDAIPLFVVKAEAMVLPKATTVTVKREGKEAQVLQMKDPKHAETLIFPGDIVEFSGEEAAASVNQFYFVSGEINSGGKKQFVAGMTLWQAIVESGGLKKNSVRKVIVRRKNEAGLLVAAEFDLKSIRDGKIADPVILAGDTIEVGN
jgi:protein involved in polysaccharide export with SLBB domain